ncbi:MAG: addiction module protein [Arcobacteraceae bacterium]|nr:addiction module protein [Arcobacteraceae bacterium]MDY0364496.1 addiction module protein [Arcobacteraceae bacterium]
MEDLSIKRLEPKEKVILMNEIWESLDDEKLHIESPKWHKGKYCKK